VPGRIQVFISHTKQASAPEEDVAGLVEAVVTTFGHTRLRFYFDARDLQPGEDWDEALRANAATGALLALRTDQYASREWCQREMVIAKRRGLPVVILDSLGQGEERGSYLLDHVARIPVTKTGGYWSSDQILRCLNHLVDECLKRALWLRQGILAQDRADLNVAWWAPHAPELLTLSEWLEDKMASGGIPPRDLPIRILHPDPPLGPEEVIALKRLVSLAGVPNELDIMTPRLLAARGG